MTEQDSDDDDEALKRRERDYPDYSNELAGRSTKIARFIPESVREEVRASKNKEDLAEFLTALDLALQDPVYAALYDKLLGRLVEMERQTEHALESAQEELKETELEFTATLNQASKLPGGASVFRDMEGNVWTEDGRLLEGEELDQVVWRRGKGATYEEYLRHRKQSEYGHPFRALRN